MTKQRISYRVEYSGYNIMGNNFWTGRNFNDMDKAVTFYHKQKIADLLQFTMYKGYTFIASKGKP